MSEFGAKKGFVWLKYWIGRNLIVELRKKNGVWAGFASAWVVLVTLQPGHPRTDKDPLLCCSRDQAWDEADRGVRCEVQWDACHFILFVNSIHRRYTKKTEVKKTHGMFVINDVTLHFESAGITPSSTQMPWNWDVFYVALWCVLEFMPQTWNILSPIPVVLQMQGCLCFGGILHFRWRCPPPPFQRFQWQDRIIPFPTNPTVTTEETSWHGWAWRICLGRMLGCHYEKLPPSPCIHIYIYIRSRNGYIEHFIRPKKGRP